MATSSDDDRIVVGIDFGTTFSGVAFTYSGNPETADEISVLKNWPGGNNITSEKVPSELTYDVQATPSPSTSTKRYSSGVSVSGASAVSKTLDNVAWGYQVKPSQVPLRYLKLLLDPRQQLPSYVSKERLQDQLIQLNKTPTEAVSHYLSLLHNETKDALVRRYGREMVETTRIDFVLTVPAVWSDTAKDATLKAAEHAGLGPDLHMISEPEAAAIYSLKSMEHHNLVSGDNFIVCDAGGGTVDLISYEICSLSPLRLQESVPGTGALCGGAFLNIRFENLVKNRMGPELFQDLCKRKPRAWAIALNNFEDYVKRIFDPSSSFEEYDDNKFNVPLPGAGDNAEAGIDCGFLTLSTADVAELFRPIIDQVIELVERQRSSLSAHGKTAKGVILVGGFGQSNHLFKSLRTRFADEDPPPPYSQVDSPSSSGRDLPKFIVRQPANAWTAVVRGAVLNGLEGAKLVVSRKSRRHYGVRCREFYDQSVHSPSNRQWCPLRGKIMAENQICWHVRKGQTLLSGEPVLLDFAVIAKHDTEDTYASLRLIVSDEEDAPREFSPSRQTRILCGIKPSLQDVPSKRWVHRSPRSRNKYKELAVKVGMTVESGGLRFDCRVDGVVYGSVRADFE